MRKALFVLGLISIIYGTYNAVATINFIKNSVKVTADVIGFSSVQTLDRVEGDCSAFRKSCAAKVSFTMPNAEKIETLVPQPLFARVPAKQLSLFVNPNDPNNPRIASAHVLFRNSSSTLFLGIICIFLGWVIGGNKKKGV
jgi:hypothetical protein